MKDFALHIEGVIADQDLRAVAEAIRNQLDDAGFGIRKTIITIANELSEEL